MEQTVLELKAKCEAIEKRESERRAMDERKHSEETAFLKKTNLQLKVRRNMEGVGLLFSHLSHSHPAYYRHNWKASWHHKRNRNASHKCLSICNHITLIAICRVEFSDVLLLLLPSHCIHHLLRFDREMLSSCLLSHHICDPFPFSSERLFIFK